MNKSEILFFAWCKKHEFECNKIKESNTSTPDFEITKFNKPIYAEIKEIVANEEEKKILQQLEEKGWSGAYGEEPGKTIREKIKDSYPQLKQYAEPNEAPAILVLYNNTGMLGLGRIDSYNILTGMFGLQSVPIYISEDSSAPPKFGRDYFGPKKSVAVNRNRYLSAIVVLYENHENIIHSLIYHNPYAKYKIEQDYFAISDSFQYRVNMDKLNWETIKDS